MGHYLITGGCGFIGSHLAEALLALGHQLSVIDDLSTGKREHIAPEVTFYQGDVAEQALLSKVIPQIDGVFHLAAIASVVRCTEDWSASHRVNQTATIRIFETVAKLRHVPVVYASSAAIYGDQGSGKIAEHAVPSPQSAYGADKYGSELHGFVASSVHNVPTMGLRFFNVYGPRQDPSSPYSGVISIFADRIQRNEGITIFGDGSQCRDFIEVSDVVSGLISAMNKIEKGGLTHEICNLCTGQTTTILQLAQIIQRVTGNDVSIEHKAAREGDIYSSLGDPSKMQQLLAVKKMVRLEEGLNRLVGAGS